jgi:RNA polymerase sigma factor (sigma-70 family)
MNQRMAESRKSFDSSSDVRLVKRCLAGDAVAWNAILAKYKNLIFSIPVKQGFSPEDCSDIFQSVCVDLLNELPRLREPRALAGWLIKVTTHRCFHWKRRESRYVAGGDERELELGLEAASGGAPSVDEILEEVEREQMLREAVRTLPVRCRRLVEMLFYSLPPVPYAEVARKLGLARGSIGFIRRRCLDRLRRGLEASGITMP